MDTHYRNGATWSVLRDLRKYRPSPCASYAENIETTTISGRWSWPGFVLIAADAEGGQLISFQCWDTKLSFHVCC
jgi:hypothetical protein